MNVFFVADWSWFLLLGMLKTCLNCLKWGFFKSTIRVTSIFWVYTTSWRYLFSNIFTTCIPNAFIYFFPNRNHQCGLRLVIWQVTYRPLPPPSPLLSCPLFPSLPSAPPPPPLFPLSIFSLIPLFPTTKIHHAYQRVPHPHAHECGGIPHRPALHDPGEVKTPYLPNSHEKKWVREGTHEGFFKSAIATCPIMKWLVTRCLTLVEYETKRACVLIDYPI